MKSIDERLKAIERSLHGDGTPEFVVVIDDEMQGEHPRKLTPEELLEMDSDPSTIVIRVRSVGKENVSDPVNTSKAPPHYGPGRSPLVKILPGETFEAALERYNRENKTSFQSNDRAIRWHVDGAGIFSRVLG